MSLDDLKKVSEILEKKENKKSNVLVWVIAIIGIMIAVCAIAYALYRFLTPDYLEDFEDEFEEDDVDGDDEEEDEDDIFEDEGENE